MTAPDDLPSKILYDASLLEEVQFLDHRIRFGPTHSGWVSFVARQGHRPTIFLASDRDTLLMESQKLIKRQIEGRS